MSLPWIILAVLAGLLMVMGILPFFQGYRQRPTDYRAIFLLGLLFLIIGLSGDNNSILPVGALFTILGLSKKKNWGKNKVIWKKLSKEDRQVRLVIIVTLLASAVAALIFFTLTN